MVRDAGFRTCKTGIQHQALTEADTQIDAHFLRNHPEMCEIIKRWPDLHSHIKAAILALLTVDSKGDHDAS
jgi:hypothetical protein